MENMVKVYNMESNEDEILLKEIVNNMLNNRIRHYRGFWIAKFSGEVVFVLKKSQNVEIMSYDEILINPNNYCTIKSTIDKGILYEAILYGHALHDIRVKRRLDLISYHADNLLKRRKVRIYTNRRELHFVLDFLASNKFKANAMHISGPFNHLEEAKECLITRAKLHDANLESEHDLFCIIPIEDNLKRIIRIISVDLPLCNKAEYAVVRYIFGPTEAHEVVGLFNNLKEAEVRKKAYNQKYNLGNLCVKSLEKNGITYYHVIDVLPVERFSNINI